MKNIVIIAGKSWIHDISKQEDTVIKSPGIKHEKGALCQKPDILALRLEKQMANDYASVQPADE